MSDWQSTKKSFPLRLSASIERAVRDAAEQEGISINRFIEIALAEKMATLNVESSLKQRRTSP